ncbi:MAG: glycosyltransferase family 2 protein [Planctomycetes bacterium]|nr:glycosyltransferase family 2 protein [Planctomycetota bacterium]
MKVTVLVPAFNEEGTIEKVLSKLVALPLESSEILVVDDGSTDNTAEIVAALAAQNPSIRWFKQPRNMGKTAAIARAISESTGEILIIQDADLEYDPEEIADVIAPILNDVADVVYGSRFLVKKASRVLYFYHYVANKFLTLLSNLLTNRNMSDIETCYKAFRREVIVPLDFSSRGFGLEVEITAMICKTNARTYEVPISYYGRTYEEGKKIGVRDGIAAIWYILYFNLITPLTPSGQSYIQTVNNALAKRNSQG